MTYLLPDIVATYNRSILCLKQLCFARQQCSSRGGAPVSPSCHLQLPGAFRRTMRLHMCRMYVSEADPQMLPTRLSNQTAVGLS